MLRFCKGVEHPACARLEFYMQFGFKPDDDMTPLGDMIDAGDDIAGADTNGPRD